MSVGAIGGSYASSYSPYSVISSGGDIKSAAQDAAGLAIKEKTEAQVKGLDQGKENLQDAKSALNIEDSAMEGIADYLKSIKELAIKSINGTLSDEDKGYIQNQIDQYKQGINDIAGNTSFNEKKLLDGSNADLKIAADGSGSTEKVSTYDSTVAALGIEDFDVTRDSFDMSALDKALETVQNNRTTVGSQTNAMDYAASYNSKASLELNGFQMDQNEERSMQALQELKTRQALDIYQAQLQNKQQEDQERKAQLFLA